MTRAEIRAYGVTLGGAGLLVGLILGAQDLADYVDRSEDARIAHRAWIANVCMPGDGQMAVARRVDGKIECVVYARYERGMAREVVSAAVAVVP
jgi:hypothetical protein